VLLRGNLKRAILPFFLNRRWPSEEIVYAEDTRGVAPVTWGFVDAGDGVGRTFLRPYLCRARDADLSWPLSSEFTDADLELPLFPRRTADSSDPISLPDWAYVQAEQLGNAQLMQQHRTHLRLSLRPRCCHHRRFWRTS